MNSESKKFLIELLGQCGPSGFEEKTQSVWVKRTNQYTDEIRRDVHGNAIGVINPKVEFKIMLAGHSDEIGFIITHISDGGYLYISPIGGIDAGVVPGSQVKVQTQRGWVDGVIGKKAIHLMEDEDRKKISAIKDLWVDIGAKNREDALKAVAIGDPVSFAPNFLELRNNFFSSKGCDNKMGAFVVSEVLKLLHHDKSKLKLGVYAVSTVQEEVGLRGATTSAYGINPNAAMIVDVGHASDVPDIDKRIVGEAFLGKGPILHAGPVINRVLGKLLIETAKKKKIPYQFSSLSRTGGTDAGSIQLVRSGVATALLSVPNRYMHTMVEMCSFDDVVATANLIAETILTIDPKMSFIPE